MKQISKIIFLIIFIICNTTFASDEGSWFKKGVSFSTFNSDQIVNCHYFAAGNSNVRALDISFLYYNPDTYEKTATISVQFFKLLAGLDIPSEEYQVTKKELKSILPKGKFIGNNQLVFFIKNNIFKLTIKENNASILELLYKSSNTIYDIHSENNKVYSINSKGIHLISQNKASSLLKWKKQNWSPNEFKVNINNKFGLLTLRGEDKGEAIFKSIVFDLNRKSVLKTYEHQNSIAILNKELLLAYTNEITNRDIKVENFMNSSTISENTNKTSDFSKILKTVVCNNRFMALETATKTFVIDILSGELKKTIDFSSDYASKGCNENLLTGFKNQKLYFAKKSISLSELFKIEIDKITPQLFVNNLSQTSENITSDSFISIEGLFKDDSAMKTITLNNEKINFNSKDGSFKFTTNIEYGINKFVISGTDLFNNTKTEIYIINREELIATTHRGQNNEVEQAVQKQITDFNYKALLISNEKYTNGIEGLDFPNDDAEKLANILKTKYTFEENNIIHLKDAKRSDIINTLDSLATVLTSKDNLLIFYAGHGVYDEVLNKGYWIPVDASFKKDNWVSNSDIKDYIAAIKSQHTLLISDACFSGSIFEYKHRSLNSRGKMVTEKLLNKRSRKAMTSGLDKTVPDESIFIKYLIKTLTDNNKAYLRAGELYNDIREAVMANTDNNPQFEVIKDTNHEGGEFIFLKKEE